MGLYGLFASQAPVHSAILTCENGHGGQRRRHKAFSTGACATQTPARQLFFGSFRASPVRSYRGGANARDEWKKETRGRSIGRVGVGVDLFDAMRRGSIRP